MSMTLTEAAPSASERVTGKSLVMPIWWAMSAIGWRPVLIERFTGTVLIDCAKAEIRLMRPTELPRVVARAPVADALAWRR